MKKLALVPLLLLAGCVEQQFFVRQGVTADKYERDTVACATQAAQAVPVNTQVGWAPYVGIYSVDTNGTLRQQNTEICMRDKGYQKMPIPYCDSERATPASAAASAPRNPQAVMRIAANTCYIFDAKGVPFIYTPPEG